MGRQTWLAQDLRAAGLKVVEVTGWKTRGSESFNPVGVTWHATAGSRNSTAQSEVNVILNGSPTAPPPIAQLMIYRDGTIYICGAGRCNHNKVGWGGPNKGLGNSALIGIEMANDNRGEPWPAAQLDAARRATVVIFRRLGTDPRQRLAAHYEHQPATGRPVGETSTKTDPRGVNMTQERARVHSMMSEEDDLDPKDKEKLGAIHHAVTQIPDGKGGRGALHTEMNAVRLRQEAILAAVQGVNEEGILARINELATQEAARDAEAASRDGVLLGVIQDALNGRTDAQAALRRLAEIIENAVPESNDPQA